MKWITFFLMLLQILPANAFSKKKSPPLHLNRLCKIFDLEGNTLGLYPGEMCVFLPDGSFLSSTRKNLRHISKNNEVIWELAGHFHHQLKLSNDGKRILTLSSSTVKFPIKHYRADKLMVISMDGKVLHERTSETLLNEVGVPFMESVLPDWLVEDLKLYYELSHFNSISEIPKITKGHKNTFLKEGDIIVNALTQGVFVLSPDLQTIRSHRFLSDKKVHKIHDVQANATGNLLFFNNATSDTEASANFSTIQEIDTKTKKIIFEFKANPKQMFYSQICGSVQELESGNLLFADNLNGTFIYSKEKKNIVSTIRATHYEHGQRIEVQHVKGADLTDFLAQRKETSF
jgi:hypothetical protein